MMSFIYDYIFKFIWCFVSIYSLQKIYNYSDLGAKNEVTLLLAVLSALLPDGFILRLAAFLSLLMSVALLTHTPTGKVGTGG